LRSKVDEVSAVRGGDFIPTRDRPQTVDELLDVFLEKHGRTLDSLTVRKMTAQFRKVRAEFGDRHPDSLRRIEVEDWHESLPPASRHGVLRVFRQALTWGVDRGLVERNAQRDQEPTAKPARALRDHSVRVVGGGRRRRRRA
jgi:hypothetical protein